jgi:hypothetical protein
MNGPRVEVLVDGQVVKSVTNSTFQDATIFGLTAPNGSQAAFDEVTLLVDELPARRSLPDVELAPSTTQPAATDDQGDTTDDQTDSGEQTGDSTGEGDETGGEAESEDGG